MGPVQRTSPRRASWADSRPRTARTARTSLPENCPGREDADDGAAEYLAPRVANQFLQAGAADMVCVPQFLRQLVEHAGLIAHFLAQARRLEDEVQTEDECYAEQR